MSPQMLVSYPPLSNAGLLLMAGAVTCAGNSIITIEALERIG